MCSASTLGLLALWCVVLSYACYLVMLQHVLSTRPYPFTIFAWASLCGDIGICAFAAPQMSQVRGLYATVLHCGSCLLFYLASHPPRARQYSQDLGAALWPPFLQSSA